MSLRALVAVGLILGAGAVTAVAASAQERFPDPPPAHGLYSDAVRVGDLVFLSGVVSGDADPTTQFTQAFERIERILEEVGSSMSQVIDITTYHIGMHDHIEQFIQVKNQFMSELPSWTAVGVTELYSAGVLIEIKVIAAVTEGS